MIEFTLVGIPMIFLLISIFEISRAMWNYHTLAFAIREGTRYAAVHGSGCSADPRATPCQATVAQVAQRIQDAGIGPRSHSARSHVHVERQHDQVHLERVPHNSDKTGPKRRRTRRATRSRFVARFRLNRPWPCSGQAQAEGSPYPTAYLTAGSADIIQF